MSTPPKGWIKYKGQEMPATDLLAASPHQAKLFDLVYSSTFQAADAMSQAYSSQKITLQEARAVLAHLTAATAAMQSFNCLLSGQDEPERG